MAKYNRENGETGPDLPVVFLILKCKFVIVG